MAQISALPALEDNYIWLIVEGAEAAVVDPGAAAPVLERCEADGLSVRAILVTHHHPDHTDGIAGILERHGDAKVYSPQNRSFAFPYQQVSEGDHVKVDEVGMEFTVYETPGHTLDHVSYHAPGHLFCGDTIFGCGCGKLLEGTAKQMFLSIEKLSALPGDTLIYCGHEYTMANIRFALAADPNNSRLEQRERADSKRRANGEPTLPSTLELEKETNPFLRWQAHAIKSKAEKRLGKRPEHTYEILGALRTWKDRF